MPYVLTYVFFFNSGCVVVMGKSGLGNVDWRPTDVFVPCRDQQSSCRRMLRAGSREPMPQAGERQRRLTTVGLFPSCCCRPEQLPWHTSFSPEAAFS